MRPLRTQPSRQVNDQIVDFRPDLLISDIGMPNVDGYELCADFAFEGRDSDGSGDCIDGIRRSEDRTRALLAGYTHHVAKPIEPSELLATIAVASGRLQGHGLGVTVPWRKPSRHSVC